MHDIQLDCQVLNSGYDEIRQTENDTTNYSSQIQVEPGKILKSVCHTDGNSGLLDQQKIILEESHDDGEGDEDEDEFQFDLVLPDEYHSEEANKDIKVMQETKN
jgi:hypothetical protein